MHRLFTSLIQYPFALLEFILGLRLLLKFLGAGEQALIVDLLYKATDAIIMPFQSIFPNISVKWWIIDGVVDIVAISAMLGYCILALILLKAVDVLFEKRQSYKN